MHKPPAVDMRDRTAAGADRTHVDLGDSEQVVVDLRLRRDDDLMVAKRRDVERRSAHVTDNYVAFFG